MAIPDFQSLMLPLLKYAKDRQEHSLRDGIEALAEEFELTEEERKELLPSGRQATFDNRVAWARSYMGKAGLIESHRRGYFRIADRGLEVLKSSPSKINIAFLGKFPEFVEFRAIKREKPEKVRDVEPTNLQTPEEVLESSYLKVRQGLAADVLQSISNCSPAFFERLVIDLLVKMGYGGTRKDAGEAVGKSGDDGIDGIIKEDRLGLDAIYIQAKRWQGSVGRPEIQKFVGALQGHRARKGIFITTSDFTKEAEEYVSRIETKIILIDGERLSYMMIDHNVGVTPIASYEIKRVDSDYFTE
jgi:restriction system protein